MGEKNGNMDRTSMGLRNALFDEIDALRNGTSNPARARSLAMLANTALKSVEVEIEYHKYVSDVNKLDGAATIGSLDLGGEALKLGVNANDIKPKPDEKGKNGK